jgi:hypothetical protein
MRHGDLDTTPVAGVVLVSRSIALRVIERVIPRHLYSALPTYD